MSIPSLANGRPLIVWVLAPAIETGDPAIDYYSDYSQSRAEFERAFAELGVEWRWVVVTTRNVREVIDGIAASTGDRSPLVFNLCDGDDVNGVPGVGVIEYLREVGLPFTGADERFYRGTTSKIDMKRAFDRAGVPTPAWEIVVPPSNTAGDEMCSDLRGVVERCGAPLIVKPAVSAGSMGVTIKSVVSTDDELREQLQTLHQGYHGWDLVSGGVFVERFIAGREFTTFIVGSANGANECIVYPPAERVFHPRVPVREQFLSYDRLWEVYERETPIGDGEYLWQYAPAPAALVSRIREASLAAYASVDGCGYGRVDLRMDAASGELFVLEVNAQCGLSEHENDSSIGAILGIAERPFHEMVREIVCDALMRRPATT